jgi:hypothetical protein
VELLFRKEEVVCSWGEDDRDVCRFVKIDDRRNVKEEGFSSFGISV